MKNLFYNQETSSLRNGWRIAICLLCYIIIVFIITSVQRFFSPLEPIIGNTTVKNLLLFILYASITITTWFILRFIDKRPFYSLGISFKGNFIKELSQGIFLGFVMMSSIFIIEYFLGMATLTFKNFTSFDIISLLFYSVMANILIAYGEEFLFRGYIFQSLLEGTNKVIAIIILSLLFGIAHAINPNVTIFSIINIVVAGILLSTAYIKTHSLWLSIGIHFSWNFTQGCIFSFPVSGQVSKNTITTLSQTGPEWITGGAFGPEGGILSTIIVGGTIFFIYYSPWFSISKNSWSFSTWLEEKASLSNK